MGLEQNNLNLSGDKLVEFLKSFEEKGDPFNSFKIDQLKTDSKDSYELGNSKLDELTKIITIEESPKSRTTSEIKEFSSLGKEIKISPKAKINVNKEGYKTEYFVETIEVLIGIGKDYTATLIMSKEAYEALNEGELISITTNKEFQDKYFKKRIK